MGFLFWVSWAALGATLWLAIDAAVGWRRLGALARVAPDLARPPALSVVVPARNEAGTVEPALRSLLALDYPALEVVAIDDRSSDATGGILDRLAAEFPALRVAHVRELPAGWLGKNHAMHLGAARARGDYILFTDADVHFAPSALTRAVAHCEARALEHLAVFPDVPARSRFLAMSLLAGMVGLLARYRPWRAVRTGRHGMGVGAFNLVRAEAYREAGGHASIALEVLDDIELGRLMGRRGRQELLLGMGMVSVEIYRDAAEMVRGIQKNVFAFFEYRFAPMLAASAFVFATSVWPWVGLVATDGPARWVNLATSLLLLATHADAARRFRYSALCLAYLPLNGVLTLLLFWQIAIATRLRGGIVWRGTFYPLAELRRARRRR